MKKTILIIGLVVAALVVAGVGQALAQGTGPSAGNGPMMQNGGGYLHTYMVAAFAEQLGLTVDEVNTRLAAGETMYDIAIASGVKPEDVPALMIEVRSQALSAAVEAGVITQEQATWMSAHGFGRGGYGAEGCPMHDGQGTEPYGGAGMMGGRGRGMMGAGSGWHQQANPYSQRTAKARSLRSSFYLSECHNVTRKAPWP
jgi:hypothetical protein